MDLILSRGDALEAGVFGSLIDTEDNLEIAVTLEHAYRGLLGLWYPKVPRGIYTCQRGLHRLRSGEPFETFEVLNVPAAVGILFHPGNFDQDSEGCILLGRSRQGNMIVESRKAFEEFMTLQNGVQSFNFIVEGP